MRLSDNVYAVLDLAHPIGVNAGFVVTGEGVVVIDSGLTHSSALTILGYIDAVAPGGLIKYLVLTEHHSDHIFGAQAFKARGAEIIAHKLTRQLLTSSGDGYVQSRMAEIPGGPDYGSTFYCNVQLVLPDRIIDEPTDLVVADELFRLIPTPGHLRDCVSVYLPRTKILFAGDTIYSGYPPTTRFGDALLWKEWVGSLPRLRQLEIELVVPGHGPLCDRSEIDRSIGYLRRLLGDA